jgi:hypothetical protein
MMIVEGVEVEPITAEEAIYLMKVTINSSIKLGEINTDLIRKLLLEYRPINSGYDKLIDNVQSGKEILHLQYGVHWI